MFKLSELEVLIIKYIANSRSGYWHSHKLGRQFHFHKTHEVSEGELFSAFQDEGYSEKQIAEAVAWLRLNGHIFRFSRNLNLRGNFEKIGKRGWFLRC